MTTKEDRSLIGRLFIFLFELAWSAFQKASLFRKIVILFLIFLLVFWETYRCLETLIDFFGKPGATTKGYSVWLKWESSPTTFIIFPSWLHVAAVLFALGFYAPNSITASSCGLIFFPFFNQYEWAFAPPIFLVLAVHAFITCCYYRKRHVWIIMTLYIYVCISLYLLGITVCLEDIDGLIRFIERNW